jgi:hypothetical protein
MMMMKIHNVFHISLLKPVSLGTSTVAPPPPTIIIIIIIMLPNQAIASTPSAPRPATNHD